MSNLEETPVWRDILRQKDSLTLKELSERFRTTPAAISAAFKRTGTTRQSPLVHAVVDSDLPPEPGEFSEAHAVDAGLEMLPEVRTALERLRPGSKDELIAKHAEALGNLPDAEVARLANVSIRTVASFRARHNIPGYRGPRRMVGPAGRKSRIDPFVDLLGKVPDRVVAEKAGVSLNAVRNYRVKRGIPAAGRTETPVPSGATNMPRAWRLSFNGGNGTDHVVVVAGSMEEAMGLGNRMSDEGELVGVRLVGRFVGA